MSRNLSELDPRIRPLADQLLEQSAAAGVPLTVICTLRTVAEQRQAVLRGVSWTYHSRHLPQPPDGLSLAIDVCPTHLLIEKNWAPADPAWWVVARIGVALGLRCGMDWNGVGLPPVGKTRPSWDSGHYEIK